MLRSVMTSIVAIVWVIVLALVGARFLALLADANGDSEIVDRIYRHSDFWVKPFFGMFDLANKAVEETGGAFEPASLIAFVVYFLAGALVLSLLATAWSRPAFGGHGGVHHEV